jgi:ABC-type glycerol-3-phosphate transport system substrate-binding protein
MGRLYARKWHTLVVRIVITLAVVVMFAAACGGDSPASTGDDPFPSVLGAEATLTDDGTWRISATLSSPYDSPDRYADAWRVLGPDGTELAVRVLVHDHASEQPFTRSLSGVEIPADVDEVTIEGRDLLNGWGGPAVRVGLDRGTGSGG